MCAIDYATIKRSKAQFRSRQFGTAAPTIPLAPSTFTSSTSAGGVTLDTIMAQLQCMDTRLDTLSTELYWLNTCVDRIARWQARLSGFVESPSPPPKAPEASEDDDDSDDDDDGEDGDTSSDEMST